MPVGDDLVTPAAAIENSLDATLNQDCSSEYNRARAATVSESPWRPRSARYSSTVAGGFFRLFR
jgi:hypothetical protein